VPDQKFALGALQGDREGGQAAARVCFLPEQRACNLQIGDGGIVGRRLPRTLASGKIDGNDPLPLDLVGNSGDATVELVGNDVKLIAPLERGYASCQRHADAKMQSPLFFVRPQRIGGLLHAVVHKPVGAIETLDQFKTSRLPQIRVDLLFR